ncbi:MAG: glutamine synthetase family protein [Coriobacteriales bacterium]|jgi:glutamine synthetase|nr:glutamine synthetase family protein [Coriobacteriales bacterium]
MSYTKEEVLEFVQANDVKFVRLLFCDLQGTPKNVAVMADYLPQVFETGATFDAAVLDGDGHATAPLTAQDEWAGLILRPDPATLAVLPWRPQSGRAARMYCDVMDEQNLPLATDGRGLLRAVRQKAMERGLLVKAGCECGFYLFELDDEGLPTHTPHDQAGYLDIAPLDRCENVRRDICLTLEELGMAPMGSYHERGPGQNNVWCRATDILTCADDIITYKTVVRTIAAQHGLFASFMPRPLPDAPDSRLFINLTLESMPGTADEVSAEACASFMAGIAARIPELMLFVQPSTNAYTSPAESDDSARLTGASRSPGSPPLLTALDYLSWAGGRPSQLIRIPYKDSEARRVELGGFDALSNPYYVLSLLLAAGLEGMERNASLAETVAAAQAGSLTLPTNLGEALAVARSSGFVSNNLPPSALERIFTVKQQEWEHYVSLPETNLEHFSAEKLRELRRSLRDGLKNSVGEDRLSFEQTRYFAQI